MLFNLVETNLFDNVIFNEDSHTYFLDEVQLTSTSEKISMFYEKFPLQRAAYNKAMSDLKKSNLELDKDVLDIHTQRIIEHWDTKGKLSRYLGSILHEFANFIIVNQKEISPNLINEFDFDFYYTKYNFNEKLTNDIHLEKEKLITKCLGLIKFFVELENKQYEIVHSELRMGNKNLKLAGTTDLVLKKDNKYIIADFKTNEDLNKNYAKYLFKPFDSFIDSPINKYMIQLSTYKILISQLYHISELWVIHIQPENYNIIQLPDVSNILKDIYYGNDAGNDLLSKKLNKELV